MKRLDEVVPEGTYLLLTRKFFTPSEVARRVGVSRQTVVGWINEGRIPSHTTPGGHHRIPVDAFDGPDADKIRVPVVS